MRVVIYLSSATLLSQTTVSAFLVRQEKAHRVIPSLTLPAQTLCKERRTVTNLTPSLIHDFGIATSQETAFLPNNLLLTYQSWLNQNPIAAKATTSAILASIGDAIAQFRSTKKDQIFQYDIKRGIYFLGFGALYTGAFQHFWFQFLEGHITQWGEQLKIWGPTRAAIPVEDMFTLDEWWMYFDIVSKLEDPPSDAALAAGKLMINQFFMIPGLYMPLFFLLTGALAQMNLRQSIARAQTMYFSLLSRNYFFWLPMQFVQFLIIPTEWQIPFISAASLVWTVILSSIAGSSKRASEARYGVEERSKDLLQGQSGCKDITDEVTLEDVEEALIPQAARETLSNPKVGAAATGGFVALLAAAADDGLLGEVVASLFGAKIGAGIAGISTIGAGVGLLVASRSEDQSEKIETSARPEDQMTKTSISLEGSPSVENTTNLAIEGDVVLTTNNKMTNASTVLSETDNIERPTVRNAEEEVLSW